MHLSESHFKLLVRVGVCMGTAVETDKCGGSGLCWSWDTHVSGVGLGICLPFAIYVVDEHQGHTLPHH